VTAASEGNVAPDVLGPDVIEEVVAPGVLRCTLNRADHANMLTKGMMEGLRSSLTRSIDDDEVHIVVITGAGASFCEGVDPAEAEVFFASTQAYRNFLITVRDLYLLFAAVPKPIIAAVNGVARMGGIELALACDLIVASSAARIGDGHPGGIGGGGVSKRLPEAIGARNARWLMYTGALVDAARAYQLGLVQQVYPADRFDAEVIALAQQIAGRRMGRSLARIKALTMPEQPGLAQLHDEIDQSIRQYFDPDVLAGFAEWQAAELP
jgi:enoyl-CoA hydratase/carnithine racemase